MGLFAVGKMQTLTLICIGEKMMCLRIFLKHDHRIPPFFGRMRLWCVARPLPMPWYITEFELGDINI
jgi:hypothetical protein